MWFRPQLPATLRLVDRAAAGVRDCIHRSGQTIGTAFGVLRSVLFLRHVSDSFSDILHAQNNNQAFKCKGRPGGLYGKVTVGG